MKSLVEGGSNPWRGFDSETAPVLSVARVQRIPSRQCGRWVDALVHDRVGEPAYAGPGAERTWSWRGWEPWTEDELDHVRECDRFPCAVKLNGPETALLTAAPMGDRIARFESLVLERARLYERDEERPEHEFPGAPVDPWRLFDEKGFRSRAPRPSRKDLRLRTLDFASGKIQPVRQVLDERSSETLDQREATFWVRDVYTDHYFDSWGEWTDVRCDESSGSVWITQGILVEVDQFKKSDLLSRLARSRIKSAVESAGNAYLDRWVERLRKLAEP